LFGTDASGEPVTTIRNNGSPANRVDLVILGDGYTAGQLAKYAADVEAAVQGFFADEAFREYQLYFNVHRIDVTSAESGADHPERLPPVFRNTALDATYNCASIQRLICVNTTKVNSVVSASVPVGSRDMILVLVNDPEYGGSGGAIAVSSIHALAIEIVLHEVGHSVGLLADEYWDAGPPFCVPGEPPEVNVTQQTNRTLIKWKNWIEPTTPIPTPGMTPGVPGLYVGGQYCATQKFRPTHASKMRFLNVPFEQINTEQLVKRIYNWVSPLESSEPTASNLTLSQGETRQFSVTMPTPFTHVLEVSWTVDGAPAGTGTSFTLDAKMFGLGNHVVGVTIRDLTPMVRTDPEGLLNERRTWSVTIGVGVATRGDDLVVDFGSSGLWLRYNSFLWRQLHAANPEETASGDVDGNGQADLIVDFPGSGVWVWLNNSSWFPLHPSNVASLVTGDLDGNGKSAVLLDFPGSGLWIWRYERGWVHLHSLSPSLMVTGDLDGDRRDEVIINFPGAGIWIWATTASWRLLHPSNATSMALGDLDGSGRADLLIAFSSSGIWVWRNNAVWSQLHSLSPSLMATGDLDGNRQREAIIAFPDAGLWVWQNDTSWWQLHPQNAEALTSADLDSNGRADAVIDFGGAGLWQWVNNAFWVQLHPVSAEGIVSGNLDGN
jgi:hypothetical protein